MIKGFREFLLRGNVIDLAVAVVIGAAFGAIVNGLVTGIFNPLISLIFDSSDIAKAGITLRAGTDADHPAVILAWGAVISAVIQFVLTAAAIYFGLITPMNYIKKLQLRRKPAEEAPAEPPALTETELLEQIRDLLKERNEQTPPPAA
jgi:large conductance mechanosensitive channel